METLQPGTGGIPSSISDEPTVLILDQFEELWTQCDGDRREEILRTLAELGENTIAIIGMRADFYGLAAEEPLLVPLLDDSPMVVGPLTDEQLREVIVEPAVKAGMTVQSELVQVLVSEPDTTPARARRATPGALPLLSHALLGTWQRSTRKTLTVSDYYATDGIAGAVQQSAEEVYGELTERQQQLARRIFLRLVNVDEVTQTRRRAPRTELFLGDDVDDVNTVIDRFALRRLLTVDEETVEVFARGLTVSVESASRLDRLGPRRPGGSSPVHVRGAGVGRQWTRPRRAARTRTSSPDGRMAELG